MPSAPPVSQPQPSDVLDAGEDDVAAAAEYTGSRSKTSRKSRSISSPGAAGAAGVQVFSMLRQMAARGVFQRNTAPYRSAGNSVRIAG